VALGLACLGLAGLPEGTLAQDGDGPALDAGGAQEPVQLSLFAPVQLYPESTSIRGLRLTLFYGWNRDVTGFEFVVLGLNRTDGDFLGVSWAWLGMSWVGGTMTGFQGSLINLAEQGMLGLQLGVANVTGGESVGLGLGAVNITQTMSGAQVGVVNVADDFEGLQFGLVNVARRLYGVQIGLANIIQEGPLPFMVLVNASFR